MTASPEMMLAGESQKQFKKECVAASGSTCLERRHKFVDEDAHLGG